MTRYLSFDILTACYWDTYVHMSEETVGQLVFWQSHLRSVNSADMYKQLKRSKIVYSDASHSGYGGYKVNAINGMLHGQWDFVEAAKSSTWRELVAVLCILKSLSGILARNRIKWYSDNQSVTSIVHKGSTKGEL